jgi:hypothetical protein
MERDDKLDDTVFVPGFKAIIFAHPNQGCCGLAAAALTANFSYRETQHWHSS